MIVLGIVGITLVGLGSLVLLKFPDRPGGKVAWRGFEVNSVDAGLPLMRVGGFDNIRVHFEQVLG